MTIAARRSCRRSSPSAPNRASATYRYHRSRTAWLHALAVLHYFPNKDAALEAALDFTIDAFIERLRTWNASRVRGDIEGALDSISALLKDMVLETPELPRTIASDGDAMLYTDFVNRVSERCARYICESTVVDFAQHHDVLIDHVYETFYVLISGLILFIRSHPDTSEAIIKDIIASTLHIEGYTEKYPERRPER